MWIPFALAAAAAPVGVAAGAGHSCLVRHDGSAWCWGGLSPERLRAGERPTHPTPWPVPGLDQVVQLDAGGERRSCAVRRDRSVWCWEVDQPPAPLPDLQADAVSVGEAHACALDAGRVRCWGYNARGQLGDGDTTSRPAPVPVRGIEGAVQVRAGWYHSCALLGDGRVRCWGQGRSGELGDGGAVDRPLPVEVPRLKEVVDVAAGGAHTCAVQRSGRVWCWGAGRAGQLGTGGREDAARPVPVPGVDEVVDLAAGLDHVCAVRRDGSVWCWGNNEAGQLGNPMPKGHQLVPRPVGGIRDALAVSAGSQHTCVLRRGGGVACWGQNFTGQLGDGSTEKKMEPVVVIP